ncbi:Hypothetical protein CINCED_3A018952 [Cinara cedri]|uniref:Uncharacterized protein n=1 Tax=Cinara cedri TaxID=506608 RepID=A0A5E4NDK1_9HEMI|nr:Hypothetical protein CINCED_3A018952 [Cinara cedri]
MAVYDIQKRRRRLPIRKTTDECNRITTEIKKKEHLILKTRLVYKLLVYCK